jgi:hypothetical protein
MVVSHEDLYDYLLQLKSCTGMLLDTVQNNPDWKANVKNIDVLTGDLMRRVKSKTLDLQSAVSQYNSLVSLYNDTVSDVNKTSGYKAFATLAYEEAKSEAEAVKATLAAIPGKAAEIYQEWEQHVMSALKAVAVIGAFGLAVYFIGIHYLSGRK